jgi:hypothetical protein
MRAADRSYSRLGNSEVFDLPIADESLHCTGDIFDRIDLEPLKRAFGSLFDLFGPAVHSLLAAHIDLDAELGGDRQVPAKRSERFAHEFFIGGRSVHFGSVEKSDAAFDGFMEPSPIAETSSFPNLRFCI